VHPRLGGRVLAPGRPVPKRLFEGVVRAVLGCGAIAQDTYQRAEDAVVRGPVEALEIRLVTGPVLLAFDLA